MKDQRFFIPLLITIFMISIVYWNWRQVTFRSYFDTVQFVCSMVSERYYSPSDELDNWTRYCKSKADDVSPEMTKEDLVKYIRGLLSHLDVSHLDIYNPAEDKEVWEGIAHHSGMQVRAIDGHFIVFWIQKDSPAERAGIQLGDEVLKINDKGVLQSYEVEVGSGKFTLLRGKSIIDAYIEVQELKVDHAPQLIPLSQKRALVKITSFRAEYFERDFWMSFSRDFSNYNELLIDLRGNLGGNFVSMLRALSTFTCNSQTLGKLIRKGFSDGKTTFFEDNSTADYQLETVYGAKKIELNTFPDYPCFRGKVSVLVDFETASVSEVFALSMKETKRGVVYGAATSGQMVMGIWYELPMLGPGYSLSIPEANYISSSGEQIEGGGVWPDKNLFYDLAQERMGRDSWLTQIP